MKIQLLAVGRLKGPLREPVEGYERRVGRYFPFRAEEVKEEAFRGAGDEDRVRAEEGERLVARVIEGNDLIALTREGERMSSEALASYLGELPHRGVPGATFLIGGAYGLSTSCVARAGRTLSLSDFTLPHDMARLVLCEQLYRAGTLIRGEPYHKARRA